MNRELASEVHHFKLQVKTLYIIELNNSTTAIDVLDVQIYFWLWSMYSHGVAGREGGRIKVKCS